MLQCSEKFSLALRQSFIDRHWMKREWDFRTVSFVLAAIVGSKNKNIHLRDLKDVNFLLILNLLILKLKTILVTLGKITKWSISFANFHFGYLTGVCFKYLYFQGYIFTHFVYNRSFGQIWIKIIGWSIRVENCNFRTAFRNYDVPFCIWKRLLAYFGKIYRI